MAMNDVKNIYFSKVEHSKYVELFRFHYTQADAKKDRDLVKQYDGVSILIYNTDTKKLILVKQFRPAVYYSRVPACDKIETIDTTKYPPEIGVTIEICAGGIDKDKSVEEVAREEVLEECGYDVPVERLQKVCSYCAGVGAGSYKQNFFYCEVTNNMKVSEGGGVDDELIEVVEMTVDEVKEYIKTPDIASPPGFLFSIHWFLLNKPEHCSG